MTSQSVEKALPPVVEYDNKGDIKVLGVKDIVSEMKPHGYVPRSVHFSQDRLADVEVHNLYTHLSSFPTLEQYCYQGKMIPHPIAEEIYSSLIYLRPNSVLYSALQATDYITKGKALGAILARVADTIEKRYSIKLDLFSVPKRKVGVFGFIADDDGFSTLASALSFGFHKAIPPDRILREAFSLKGCERFVRPTDPLPFPVPESWKGFVTTIKVAIVGLKVSTLDCGDIFPSGTKKLACKLERLKEVADWTQIPVEEQRLTPKAYRAGINLVHQGVSIRDEEILSPGTMRLVFPGGIKVACQAQTHQAVTENGEDVDLLLDFATISAKGGLAVCAMTDPNNRHKQMTLEECKEWFSHKRANLDKIWIEGQEYQGFVGEIPVMRPGQRYTELCRPHNDISLDRISHAILNKDFHAPRAMEEEYASLVELRGLLKERMKTR